jgi:hypothetical protein
MKWPNFGSYKLCLPQKGAASLEIVQIVPYDKSSLFQYKEACAQMTFVKYFKLLDSFYCICWPKILSCPFLHNCEQRRLAQNASVLLSQTSCYMISGCLTFQFHSDEIFQFSVRRIFCSHYRNWLDRKLVNQTYLIHLLQRRHAQVTKETDSFKVNV